MSHIAIPIPRIPGEQEIIVDVRINGVAQQFSYKIEMFYWHKCSAPKSNRVECLREIINEYDKEWEVYEIGDPNEEFIPITFRRRTL